MHDIGLLVQTACIWEATARKPGNVTRFKDFHDLHYLDFLLSAAALAPVLSKASGQRPGQVILDAVAATRRVTLTNTNLGIILLLTPLACISLQEDPRTELEDLLSRLDQEDSRLTYQAIRLASPGGLGSASEQDVASEPDLPLRQIMALAADRDLVARQYAGGFGEVIDLGVPALLRWLATTGYLEQAVIGCFLEILAAYPDSLIARKSARDVATTASQKASSVLEAGWPTKQKGQQSYLALDSWLREDGHRRNPGTTADLVTACLFLSLRRGTIELPSPYPWSPDHDHE